MESFSKIPNDWRGGGAKWKPDLHALSHQIVIVVNGFLENENRLFGKKIFS